MEKIHIKIPKFDYNFGKLFGLLVIFGNLVDKKDKIKNRKDSVLEIYCKEKFNNIIYEIKSLLENNFDIEVKIKNNKEKKIKINEKEFNLRGYYIYKSCKELGDFLKNIGFKNNASKLEKYINHDFAKGIFDGMCIISKKRKNQYIFNSLNKYQAEVLKIVANELKIKLNIYPYRNYFFVSLKPLL
ncbi:MAG: hypothetical protein QXQ30_02680 [Candidatus Pacearchaeota archaeon]